MAAIVLGSVMLVALPTIRAVALQHRHTARHQHAVQEVHNILERLTARDWAEIRDEAVAEISPSDELVEILRDAAVDVAVNEDGPEKRITVVLSWKVTDEMPNDRVSATAWVYREGGSQ